MTAIDHVTPEPLALTAADRRHMQECLDHDVGVIVELGRRIGRDELGPSDLIDSEHTDPIADRVLRRRLVRAVLRHTHRAARLAELLLQLCDERDEPAVRHDRIAGSASPCSAGPSRRH